MRFLHLKFKLLKKEYTIRKLIKKESFYEMYTFLGGTKYELDESQII